MKRLVEPILFFLFSYLFLLALSLLFDNGYAESLLPIFRWEITWLAQDFHIQSLTIAQLQGENVVALTLAASDYLVGRGVLYPGTSISASTLVGQALQHPLLMFPIAFAWPAQKASMRMIRVLITLPFLLLLECLDIPLVLMGSVQDLVAANLGPGPDTSLVGWMNWKACPFDWRRDRALPLTSWRASPPAERVMSPSGRFPREEAPAHRPHW